MLGNTMALGENNQQNSSDALDSLNSSLEAPIGQPLTPETSSTTADIDEAETALATSHRAFKKLTDHSLRLLLAFAVTLALLVIGLLTYTHFGKSSQLSNSLDGKIPNQSVEPRQNIAPIAVQQNVGQLQVNGGLQVNGSLQLNNGHNSIVIKPSSGGSSSILLPSQNGTFCLSTNNCGYASQSEVAAIVVPPASLVNQLNGAITLQGTTNQIQVLTSSNGKITLRLPQDLAPLSSPNFANLSLGENLLVNGNITGMSGLSLSGQAQLNSLKVSQDASFGGTLTISALNCSDYAQGGKLTTTADGQLVCGDDSGDVSGNGGPGISGTQDYIAKFTNPDGSGFGDSSIYDAGSGVGIGTTQPAASLGVVASTTVYAGTGTVSVTAGSGTVTGSGTQFTKELAPGDIITIDGVSATIGAIASDTQLATVANDYSVNGSGLSFTYSQPVERLVAQNGSNGLIIQSSAGTQKAIEVTDASGNYLFWVDGAGSVVAAGGIQSNAGSFHSSTGANAVFSSGGSPDNRASGSVTLGSGNSTGGVSGNVYVDSGSAGTNTGSVNIGTTNASAVNIGNSNALTAVGGNLSGAGTAQFNGTSGSSYFMSSLGLGTTNPQPASALTLANGEWISGIDSSGSGYINLFKLNSDNQIQVGAALNVDGGIIFPTDGGQLTFTDLPIDANAAAGTPESYTMAVGSTNALTVYGESDGSGGVQNVRVAVGSSINPQYTLDVGGTLGVANDATINGNLHIPTGYIDFNSGTTSGTGGVAASDYAQIFGQHDAGTENSRLVLSIGDNPTDAIILRSNAPSGGAASRDMVYVDNNHVSLAQDGGSVGIGTSDPQSLLDVNGGPGNATLTIQADTDNSGESNHPALKLIQDGGGTSGQLGYTNIADPAENTLTLMNNYGGALALGTANQARLLINKNGDVGIGTITPTASLDVEANSVIYSGTGTVSNGTPNAVTGVSYQIIGTGTNFTSQLGVGDTIIVNGNSYEVYSIDSDTSVSVSGYTDTFSGASFTYQQPAARITNPTSSKQPALVLQASSSPIPFMISNGNSILMYVNSSGAIIANSTIQSNNGYFTSPSSSGSSVATTLKSGDAGVYGGAGNSGTVTVTSGSTSNGNSGNLSINSGSAAGAGSVSGNVTIDAGTGASGATAGSINVGTTNASAINIGGINGDTVNIATAGSGTVNVGNATSGLLLQGSGSLGSTIIQSFRISGDSKPRFTVTADGTLNWGSGSGATDIELYRAASGELALGNSLYVLSSASIGTALNSGASLTVGATNPSKVGEIIQGTSTQTANLLQVEDTYGNVLSGFNAQGYLLVGDGSTDNFHLSLKADTLGANATISFPNTGGANDIVCLYNLGNCVSGSGTGTGGGSGTLTGGGNANYIARWTGETSLGTG